MFSQKKHWFISTHSDGTIAVWDTASFSGNLPKLLFKFESDYQIENILISSLEKWLAISGNGKKEILLFDLSASDDYLDPIVLSGHDDTIMSMAFSTDESFFATASRDQTARLWLTKHTASNPSVEPTVLFNRSINAPLPVFSQDGKWFAQGGTEELRLWHFEESLESWNVTPLILEESLENVRSLAFSRDGLILAACTRGDGIHLLSLTEYNQIASFPSPNDCVDLQFSND
ncbi:MAG: hypothetical protein GY786_11225, partial [Proteobacteria bacterium]|nr:hypothetical protein [Pseudomonadota bacterium]